METTVIKKKLSSEVKRALENIPEKELEAWLKLQYPEFFDSNQKALDYYLNLKPFESLNDIDKIIQKDRNRNC